jgi:6-phosphogluconolactonase
VNSLNLSNQLRRFSEPLVWNERKHIVGIAQHLAATRHGEASLDRIATAAPALLFSRRALVGTAMAFGALPSRLLAQGPAELIAGTYAREGGPGLVPLTASRDGWVAGRPLSTIRNASFGVRAGGNGVRYLLDEQEKGRLGVYDRGLRPLADFSTLGADPCHAALSPDGGMLAVANYSSGSVAVWRIDRDTGRPMGQAHLVVHAGSGPNRARQAGPHAHWVGFAMGGKLLHAVDLGADAIFAHRLDPRSGAIVSSSLAYRAPAGSGPRHLARHPRLKVAYLVSELANIVTILAARPDGTFAAKESVSTLPAAFAGPSTAAHIMVNSSGTRLYVSNRGHDSIAVFAIDAAGGLNLIQHVGCGGKGPRLFLLVEERGEMLVANQRSGNVSRLPLGKDGRLGAASPGPAIPGVVFLSV